MLYSRSLLAIYFIYSSVYSYNFNFVIPVILIWKNKIMHIFKESDWKWMDVTFVVYWQNSYCTHFKIYFLDLETCLA